MPGQPWRQIGVFAAEELPRPEAPARVGEFLGRNRREAQFLGLHAAGRIEVRAHHPRTRRIVTVAFGDYSAVDFQTHELICSDWSSFRRAEARYVEPLPEPPSKRRIRLFREVLRQAPKAGKLIVPQAVAAVRALHPEAATLFEPLPHRDLESFARTLRRDLAAARGRTRK